jgi:hypothetical protein
MKKRPLTDPEKPWDQRAKKDNKDGEEIHEELETDEGDEGELDVDSKGATLTI